MASPMDFDVRSIALNKKVYPDQYLIDAINGRYKNMPPFVAMAAGQMRKELMTAGQGAAAQKELSTPKVKDRIAAELQQEHAGLAMLPAENMAGMDEEKMLAGGGIIAFADTGLVPSPEGDIDPDSYENKSEKPGRKFDRELLEKIKGIPGAVSNFFQEQNKPWSQIAAETSPSAMQAATSGKIPKGSLPTASPYASLPATVNATPTPVDLAALQKGGPQDPRYISPEMQAEITRQSRANPPGGVGTPPAGPSAAAANAANVGIGEPPKRPDRFAGLGESQEAFDKKLAAEKNAGLSDFLMNVGFTMANTVGPLGKAIAAGGVAGLPSLSASRKTIRELEKNRQDYQFNTAKAQSALDQGDQELAAKYKELADKNAYHMGLLAVERTKAGAYAASVGSKADIKAEKLNEAILRGATELHKQNMGNFQFASKFAKMSPEEQNEYFNGLRQQASSLAGNKENVAGTGYSMSDIDAAIARKQKQS